MPPDKGTSILEEGQGAKGSLALPEEVLGRVLACLNVAALVRSSAASSRWQTAAEDDTLWVWLLRDCGIAPYETCVPEEGARIWAQRELGGEIAAARGHLQRLQRSRRPRHLLRFLRAYHNGVEADVQNARRAQAWYNGRLANATMTLEILNFWPHASWVLLRSEPPEEVMPDDISVGPDGSLQLRGAARLRCWDTAILPEGRLGTGFCFILDCGPRGELFRIPPLSTLEIGSHKVSGHVDSGCMRLQCAMGRWSDSIGLPLHACSPDAFLRSTAGDSALSFEDTEFEGSIVYGLGEEWFEGCPLQEPCELGPVLYRSTVHLDLSIWI